MRLLWGDGQVGGWGARRPRVRCLCGLWGDVVYGPSRTVAPAPRVPEIAGLPARHGVATNGCPMCERFPHAAGGRLIGTLAVHCRRRSVREKSPPCATHRCWDPSAATVLGPDRLGPPVSGVVHGAVEQIGDHGELVLVEELLEAVVPLVGVRLPPIGEHAPDGLRDLPVVVHVPREGAQHLGDERRYAERVRSGDAPEAEAAGMPRLLDHPW
mmetsp:Transcript_60047/g.107120  ORF Transcript_60047/g.107120 Transcript_60047/m.107120 type:complete len:213 (+) Transcript_60047:1622-2260(+)